MRKICINELLNAKRVKSFKSVREDEVWNFVASIASREGVAINLSEMIFFTMNDVTSRAVFSKKCKDQSEFKSLLQEAILVASGFSLPDLYPSLRFLRYFSGIQTQLERCHEKLDKILDKIFNEHKEKRRLTSSNSDEDLNHHQDILDMFLNLQESKQLGMQLTNNNIKAVTMDMFSAGTETSASTIEWAIAEMIKNPKVMKKAQAEVRRVFNGKTKIEETDIQNLDYLNCIIKETLRMHSPAALLPREAIENCEINGYEIPAKARVLVNAWMIGRDPNVWTEPEVFKPERFLGSTIDFRGRDFEYIPFGAGRRICPGISFATSIIELTLAQIIYHFDWKLPDGKKPEELDMTETFGITVRKKQNLYLVPSIYVPPFTVS